MPIDGLESIDGHILPGLEFCARVYSAFDAVRERPGGVEELRMLRTIRAKKIIEELLPLAALIQGRHGPGLRTRVKWLGGSQSYDAILHCSGSNTIHAGVPKRQYVEITTAVHGNDYLTREHLNQKGFAFAPRSTSRDPKTHGVKSEPSVYGHLGPQDELVAQIVASIRRKADKRYPRPTLLLIRCIVHLPMLEDEWAYVVKRTRELEGVHKFRELVLLEHVSGMLTTVSVQRPW
jgi:hypothetical protein